MCSSPMVLIHDPNRIDNEIWRCTQYYRTGCSESLSIRNESIFFNSHLTIPELIRLIFKYFLRKYTLWEAKRETRLGYITIQKQYSELIELVSNYQTLD